MTPDRPVILAAADPSGEDALACLDRYFRELMQLFAEGFNPGDQAYAGAGKASPPHLACVLARAGDDLAGCGFLQWQEGDEAAEIKRMWVAPAFRGRGISRAILAHLEAEAVARGFATVRLDTNRALRAAQALFLRSGYQEIPRYNDNPYADHWYANRLR